MHIHLLTALGALCLLAACVTPPLDRVAQTPGILQEVMSQPETYHLHIRYTQIDRDQDGRPHFTLHTWGVPDTHYFYPASTVKLPAVLLALEKLHHLGLPREAPLLIDSLSPRLHGATVDSSSASGLPSVAHYARKILLVSDNDAFNRLYEFLGQAPLQAALQAKGYSGTRLTHRLSLPLSPPENRQTQALRLLDSTGAVAYAQAAQLAPTPEAPPAAIRRGRGERSGDSLIVGPKDFGGKNAFPLSEQQRMLQALFFPETLPPGQGFDLRLADRRFVWQYMSQWPRESRHPAFAHHQDGYVKFLLYGDTPAPVTDDLRIFNKVGMAYGYLTDNAYIVDFEAGAEFLLAVTLHVNENGIFNDDTYEYETIGLPFIAALGRAILAYERQRPRAYAPDLSPYRLRYDP